MTEPHPTDTLGTLLDHLHLDGAVFLRAEFTESWAYQSPAAEELAAALRPGRERLILFHIVARGECSITLDGVEHHTAREGDVIVLPYGSQHVVSGVSETSWVPITTLLDPPPWDELPVVRHGGGGQPTDIVCGYLESDDPLFDPGLAALPPVFVIHPDEAMSRWVRASVEYAMNGSTGHMTSRLSELLLIEGLRHHLATAPAADTGWLSALRDPVLAPALSLLHQYPERPWTLAALASEAAASRSTLDQRFRTLLGQPPMRYLTAWRMHLAGDYLANTDLTVSVIAGRVGYTSVEAFSRAFRRSYGDWPSRWRHHPI